MDPSNVAQFSGLISPGGSRVSLPLAGSASSGGESIFTALGSPPLSGPSTGSSAADGAASRTAEQKREVFSDFRRFVSFGLRRDTQPPS